MLKDKSGQLMLISAFLLAIVVITITLMLNNVIYSSNMAYVGFMDQSRYDDLSFKQATAYEAEYAVMHDADNFDVHMNDYERALNNITSIKGRYVELDSTRNATSFPNPLPLPVTHTRNYISIYGKGSNVSYIIYTGWDGVTIPNPPPPITPPAGGYVLDLTPSKYNVICGPGSSDRVILTLIVSDQNGTRMPNVPVEFHCIRENLSCIFYPGTSTEATNMTSGSDGFRDAEFHDWVNPMPGIVPIWATAGSNTSNIVYLNCGPIPPTCNDNVSLAAGMPTTTHVSGNEYEINVRFNFAGFTNDTIPTISVISVTDTQITGVAPDYNPNSDTLSFTLKLTDNSPYTVVLGLTIKAYCTTDHLDYNRNAKLTITGTKNGGVTSCSLDLL